jgi:REase_AHJR-like
MNTSHGVSAKEGEVISQYADWYSHQGYSVLVRPGPRSLPNFLRALAPDLIARRDGENLVVQIKTSSPESWDRVQKLSRALERRAGWQLQVVYADLKDPEWEPPDELPPPGELLTRLESLQIATTSNSERGIKFLEIWSILEGAARHRLANSDLRPTSRISSSALIKALLSEGLIEDDQYDVLRRALAVRNAIAHGFLNQPVDPALYEGLRDLAETLLRAPAEPVPEPSS